MTFIFAIEGNIAAGKTTLLKELQNIKYISGLKVLFLEEPVEVWESIKDRHGKNALEHFYSDNQKYAFPFQMMAYISKIQQLSALMVSQKYKNVIIIIDRSIFTDKHIFVEMLHDSGTLNDIEYNIYLKWFDAYKEGINLDGIIYLNTSVNTCMERIQKRNRPGEILISEKYLQSCHGYHEKWLDNLKEPTVLSLDGNRDLNSDYNAHIIEIQKFISSSINLLFHQKETDIIKLLKTHPIM